MIIGEWERTPLWLRWVGKPKQRRWNHVANVGGIFGEWEYGEPQNDDEPPVGRVLIDGAWLTLADPHAFNAYEAGGFIVQRSNRPAGLADAHSKDTPATENEERR